MTTSIFKGVNDSKYGINRPHIATDKWCVTLTMVSTDSNGWKTFHSLVVSQRKVREHGLKDALALELQFSLQRDYMATFKNTKPMYDAMYAA